MPSRLSTKTRPRAGFKLADSTKTDAGSSQEERSISQSNWRTLWKHCGTTRQGTDNILGMGRLLIDQLLLRDTRVSDRVELTEFDQW